MKSDTQVGSWERFLLSSDPFSITAPRSIGKRRIVWAERKQLKADIESTMIHSLKLAPSRLVLNWGPWGTGKTHAMNYFSDEANLGFIKESGLKLPLILTTALPKPVKAGETAIALYIEFLESIGYRNLSDHISKIETGVLKKQPPREFFEEGKILRNFFYEQTQSEDLATIFFKMGKHLQPDLIRRYLYMGGTSSDLRDLGIAREIKSFNDILRTLSAVFNLLTMEVENGPIYQGVIIWIDEVEDIKEIPSRDILMFRGFIRDMLEAVPYGLTIFLNYTPFIEEKFDETWHHLGEAIMKRIEHTIRFEPCSPVEAKEYVVSLMNHPAHRSKESKQALRKLTLDHFYPFSEDSLGFVVELLSSDPSNPLTPRRINKACALLLRRALDEDFSGPPHRIERELVEKYQDELAKVS